MASLSPLIYSNSFLPTDNIKKKKEENLNNWFKKTDKQIDEQHAPTSNRSSPENHELEKTLEQKGRDEQTKNQATQIEADRQSGERLLKSSNRCIFSISSVFPLDLFPDTINVEEGRVTFIFRQFLSSQSHSVDIKDISNIFIESSLFFATLQVVSRTFVQNDIKIGKLNKKKAIKARMIIEGLRTLVGRNLDTSSYQINELISTIEEMHASQGGEIN